MPLTQNPQSAPQPALQQEVPQPAPQQSHTEAPIMRFFNGIGGLTSATEKAIYDIAGGTSKAARYVFRSDVPVEDAVPPEPMLLPPIAPIKTAGNIVSATVGVAGDQAIQLAEPVAAAAGSLTKIFSDVILHPKRTVKNLGKYTANYARVVTASLKAGQNALFLKAAALADGLDRATPRLKKIPIAGIPFKIGSALGRGAKWFINAVKTPIAAVDEAVGEFQHS